MLRLLSGDVLFARTLHSTDPGFPGIQLDVLNRHLTSARRIRTFPVHVYCVASSLPTTPPGDIAELIRYASAYPASA